MSWCVISTGHTSGQLTYMVTLSTIVFAGLVYLPNYLHRLPYLFTCLAYIELFTCSAALIKEMRLSLPISALELSVLTTCLFVLTLYMLKI